MRISPLLITLLLLAGCFDQSDSAHVVIQLSNLPVAKTASQVPLFDRLLRFFTRDAYAQTPPPTVSAIHLAAIEDDQVLVKKSVLIAEMDTSGTVEMLVPSGKDRTILVVARNESYFVEYYGYVTTDLDPGAEVNISITMGSSIWGDGAPKTISTPSFDPHIVAWESAGLRVKYYLRDMAGGLIYEGYGLQVEVGDIWGFYFQVEFEQFGLRTPEFSYNDG